MQYISTIYIYRLFAEWCGIRHFPVHGRIAISRDLCRECRIQHPSNLVKHQRIWDPERAKTPEPRRLLELDARPETLDLRRWT